MGAFYERNGFHQLRRNPGFYSINGQPYDSYIYILYVNGGRRAPQTWMETFQHEVSELALDLWSVWDSLMGFDCERNEKGDKSIRDRRQERSDDDHRGDGKGGGGGSLCGGGREGRKKRSR